MSHVINSMAPELIMKQKATNKVDVYSFGCIVNEIISEKVCYSDVKIRNATEVIASVLIQCSSLQKSAMVFVLRSSLALRMVSVCCCFQW